ncbi:acyltransferase family protein [Acetobacter aceti]|uniref:acyltransferase family protein n=1 Tax=Acetobacter aceti TaxID=435 RepID=UPI001628464E|nr:acyltransferase [Acetobacter aceti]
MIGWESGRSFVMNAPFAVDIFFSLSAYVLINSYNEKFPCVNIRQSGNFLLSRFIRLYPLYFVMLLVMICIFYGMVNGIPSYFSNNAKRDFITNCLMIQSFVASGSSSINLPSWSISLEFYLGSLVVLLALFCRPLFYAVFAFFLFIAEHYGFRVVGNNDPVFHNISAGMLRLFLSMGVMIFVADIVKWFSFRENIMEILCALGVFMMAISTICLPPPFHPVPIYLISLLFAAMGIAFMDKAVFVDKIMGNSILFMLGKISYSIYLVHFPVCMFLVYFLHIYLPSDPGNWMVHFSILMTILVSCLTYEFIEKPFILMGRRVRLLGKNR